MKRIITCILLILSMTVTLFGAVTDTPKRPADTSTRKERNYVRDGNALYNSKHYPEAEVAYKKALEENPNSEAALYNLALVYIRTSGPNATGEGENDPIKEAQSILTNLARSSQDPVITERAYYNLGNMAFNSEDYAKAIDMYKNSLRRNPDNDLTRENLRLAQLKRQEQQDQQQDQNQNQDQNQQQQQQDQNKDQNQNQDQDQDKEQPQQPEQDKQQQQQQGGISDSNAEKILKTMENEENATRRRVQEAERKEGQGRQRVTGPQW